MTAHTVGARFSLHALVAANAVSLCGNTIAAVAVAAFVPAAVRRAERTRYLAALAEGVRFVASNARLRAFLAVATVGNFLIAPLAAVVLPFYARDVFGSAAVLGALTAAYGIGGLVGAAVAALAATRVSRTVTWRVTWAAYPLLCLALVPIPGLVVALVILFGIGALAGAVSPIEQSVRQEETPPETRARVFALFMASLTVVVPLAVLPAGLLIEAGSLRAAFVAFAGGNALLALVVLTSRATRRV